MFALSALSTYLHVVVNHDLHDFPPSKSASVLYHDSDPTRVALALDVRSGRYKTDKFMLVT